TPDIPRRVGGLLTSVANRSDVAGGRFCDVFELSRGRVGIVLGRVAGHDVEAVVKGVRMRNTLRAFLDAQPVPRRALQTANRVVGEDLADGFVSVVVAVHDRRRGTLTYACAGHSPPVLLGPPEHEPVLTGSAAPIGAGGRTGVRQTTILFP